jgi:hypothetical protein
MKIDKVIDRMCVRSVPMHSMINTNKERRISPRALATKEKMKL